MRRGPAPEINVTPLVDVVLVLLIIFMVVTPKLEEGPPVDVPAITRTEPRPEATAKPLVVSVGADGTSWLDDAELPADTLPTALGRAWGTQRDRRVVVRGDRNATYASVRRAFKAAQDVGFKGVSLQVTERAH